MKVIPCNIVYHMALASRLHVPKYEKLHHGHLRIFFFGGGGGGQNLIID